MAVLGGPHGYTAQAREHARACLRNYTMGARDSTVQAREHACACLRGYTAGARTAVPHKQESMHAHAYAAMSRGPRSCTVQARCPCCETPVTHMMI